MGSQKSSSQRNQRLKQLSLQLSQAMLRAQMEQTKTPTSLIVHHLLKLQCNDFKSGSYKRSGPIVSDFANFRAFEVAVQCKVGVLYHWRIVFVFYYKYSWF